MITIVESIEDRYGIVGGDDEDDETNYDFFLSCSSSPQVRQGLLPPVITLTDYNIECLGDIFSCQYRVKHISELDLADNLISDWGEVTNILTIFKGLTFLNLARNLLSDTSDQNSIKFEDTLKEDHKAIKKVRLPPPSNKCIKSSYPSWF